METEEYIQKLTQCCGISGFEDSLHPLLLDMLRAYCAQVWTDPFQSVAGYRPCGRGGAKKVMLEAHLDQIGLMVSAIDDNGMIAFENLGGVDPRILPMSEVKVLGKAGPVFGIVAPMPKQEDNPKENMAVQIKDMRIDTGFTKMELKERIAIGCPIQLQMSTRTLLDGRMSACAMDNRAGIAAVLLTLEALKDEMLPYDLYVLFSSQEELGLHGAYTGTHALAPDFAVAIDVTHGETPDAKDETGVFPLGSGAVICRGPNLDDRLAKTLISLAEKYQIPYEIEVAAGASGTTAWAIQTSGAGIPTALVSIPLRYMHTHVETLEIQDVKAVAALLTQALKGGSFSC